MKVLVVISGNAGHLAPFVKEQIDSLSGFNISFDYYFIIGKGISGYLSNLNQLKRKIISFKPDLIHAHYGLSGMLAMFVKNGYPLLTTFHGNDINTLHPLNKSTPNWNKILSGIVHFWGNHSIFVTEDIANQIKAKPTKSDIIPCHVNPDTFYPADKAVARKQLNLSPSKKYVLFSSSFDIPIKNYPLAKKACLHFDNLELIELSGYTRQEVNLLLNACDLALITSYNEGSNQFLKEAMACNRPIVSTKVGDSEWIFGKTEGCYLSSLDVEDVIINIKKALDFCQRKGKTDGRDRIMALGLDSETVAKKVIAVYKKVLKNKRIDYC